MRSIQSAKGTSDGEGSWNCKRYGRIQSAVQKAIHKRLDKVMIENPDFKKIVTQYDFENAFFYCDPPYSTGCGYEVTSTEDFDHEGLCETLKNIKGRFLLSYDDSQKSENYTKVLKWLKWKDKTESITVRAITEQTKFLRNY